MSVNKAVCIVRIQDLPVTELVSTLKQEGHDVAVRSATKEEDSSGIVGEQLRSGAAAVLVVSNRYNQIERQQVIMAALTVKGPGISHVFTTMNVKAMEDLVALAPAMFRNSFDQIDALTELADHWHDRARDAPVSRR